MTVLGGIQLLIVLGLIALVTAAALIGWERYRRRPSPQARPTAEVFLDPETGQRLRVWVDPATGGRDYRAE